MRWIVLALIAACGRINFEPSNDGDGGALLAVPQLFTTSGIGPAEFNDTAFGPDGSLAFSGSFERSVSVGGQTVTTAATGSSDSFFGVIDPSGAIRWLDHADSSIFADAFDIEWANGVIVASGQFEGVASRVGSPDSGVGQDALIVRFTPQGSFLSSAHWGSTRNVQTRALSVGSKIAFGGIQQGGVDFGTGVLPGTGGIDNAFLVITDFDGSNPAARSFNGPDDVFVSDIKLGTDGTMCVTGRFNTMTDLGGGTVNVSGSAAFVAKYDLQLGYLWARTLGTAATSQGVAIMPDGDCVATGTWGGTISLDNRTALSAGGNDAWVARFDASAGAMQWLETIDSSGTESAYGVESYPPDRVVIAGMFSGAATVVGTPVVSSGPTDAYVAALDGNGSLLWTQQVGGSGDTPNVIGGVSIDAAHTRVAVCAQFTGEIRLGELTATTDEADGFIVVLPLAGP